MGFKEWFAKPRLSDEEWRKQMAFVGKGVASTAKGIAVLLAGGWLLLVGTEYLDKRGKQLGRLGQAGPDTIFSDYPTVQRSLRNEGYCEISGQYQIQNQGELTFEIETVTVAVYLVKTQSPEAETGTYLFSTDHVLKELDPLAVQDYTVKERLYPGQPGKNGNSLQRSFGFGVPIPEIEEGEAVDDFAWFVTANATGGLPQPETWQYDLSEQAGLEDPELTRFEPKDLRMVSGGLLLSDCLSSN